MVVAATAAPAAPTTPPLGARFSALLGFAALSNLADGVLLVAVPLLALELTRSPAQISALSAATTLPWLLLALPVGVLVDRLDRRRMLLAATAVRVGVLATAAATAATGVLSLPLLALLLLLAGTAEVVVDSASTVLVPSVVPRSRLSAANSRLLGAQQVANSFVGGPLAGLVLALGAGWVFGLPALLCAAGFLLVLRGVRGGYRSGDGRRAPMTTDLREGLAYLRAHRAIRPLLVTGTALNFASAAYFAVFVLWVVGPQSAVGLDPQLFGVLLAALAAGAVAGAVVAERLLRRFPEARLITTAWMLNSLLLLVPVLVPDALAIGAAFAFIGATNMVGNVVSASLRQRLVPNRLLGRVGGVSRMVSYGSMPLGALLAGAVGEAFGLRAVFLGAVTLSVVFVVKVAVALPQRRIDEADAAVEAAAAAEGVAAAR